METIPQFPKKHTVLQNGAGVLFTMLAGIWVGLGDARASACGDKANKDFNGCRDVAIEQEKRSGRPPEKGVSLRFQIKLSMCAQSLEKDLKDCGLLRDDVKRGDEMPKAAKREPVLTMCDDYDAGSCHVVFKDDEGIPMCGRLSKSALAAMDYKIDPHSPEFAIGKLEMCPDEVLAEHARDPRPHRGPDIGEAKSMMDFDCVDDDHTARWAEGRCYSVVREVRGVPKCASVDRSRVRSRADGGLTAHRWDIITGSLDDCPKKIFTRYYELDHACANPYAKCPFVERALWMLPTFSVPARVVPIRAPAPPPAAMTPPGPDRGAERSRSEITGYEEDRRKRELGVRPDAPAERPRVGGVKVDVQSEGTPEDLSAARNEILKMRKGQ